MNHIGKLKSDIYYAQVLNTKLLHRKTNHRNRKIGSTASASPHPTSCIINVAHQNSTSEFIFTSRVNQFILTMTGMKWNEMRVIRSWLLVSGGAPIQSLAGGGITKSGQFASGCNRTEPQDRFFFFTLSGNYPWIQLQRKRWQVARAQ